MPPGAETPFQSARHIRHIAPPCGRHPQGNNGRVMTAQAIRAGEEIPRTNAVKQGVLQLLARFFCLRTAHAAMLLRNREIGESDERSVRRTLAILHRDGFVYRVQHLEEGRERGGIGYVYGLSDKGVRHAFRNGYATLATKTLDEHSIRTLDHELEITAFHIALHRLCAAEGLRYGWRQRGLKRIVHPDAVFNVADPENPAKAYCYFLEIERAKLGNYRNGVPQILRKLKRYHKHFNSTRCEKEWGFREFRIVIVQRTEERREGLLKSLRETVNHRMFTLTTEEDYRRDIGGTIFRTPKDTAPVAFAFLTRATPRHYDERNRSQEREYLSRVPPSPKVIPPPMAAGTQEP